MLIVFCKPNNIKLLYASVDDLRSMGRVGNMIQTLRRRLGVMRKDRNNPPIKLASDVVEIMKTSATRSNKNFNV